ncbi:MAG: aspartate/glutamate racemase family protein [Candidatus Omnitrophota bacterium]
MGKIIGILGGMGPEATLSLCNLIFSFTRAEKDQDHIPVMVWNNPRVPDRTEAILNQGPSPLPDIISGAQALEKMGADLIAMPCITAFYFYPDIVRHVSIPFVHILEETVRYVHQQVKHPMGSPQKIGVLATSGTIKSGLFHEAFHRNGIGVVAPNAPNQRLLMDAIYDNKGIKAGFKQNPRKRILAIIDELIQTDNPDAIMVGCTELSLVLDRRWVDRPLIDPLKILAAVSIQRAGYELKRSRKSDFSIFPSDS